MCIPLRCSCLVLAPLVHHRHPQTPSSSPSTSHLPRSFLKHKEYLLLRSQAPTRLQVRNRRSLCRHRGNPSLQITKEGGTPGRKNFSEMNVLLRAASSSNPCKYCVAVESARIRMWEWQRVAARDRWWLRIGSRKFWQGHTNFGIVGDNSGLSKASEQETNGF